MITPTLLGGGCDGATQEGVSANMKRKKGLKKTVCECYQCMRFVNYILGRERVNGQG